MDITAPRALSMGALKRVRLWTNNWACVKQALQLLWTCSKKPLWRPIARRPPPSIAKSQTSHQRCLWNLGIWVQTSVKGCLNVARVSCWLDKLTGARPTPRQQCKSSVLREGSKPGQRLSHRRRIQSRECLWCSYQSLGNSNDSLAFLGNGSPNPTSEPVRAALAVFLITSNRGRCVRCLTMRCQWVGTHITGLWEEGGVSYWRTGAPTEGSVVIGND